MASSLLVHQTPKKIGVGVMVGASLLFHGAIVGIASLWLQPEPEERTVIIDDLIPAPEGPPTLAVSAPLQVPDAATPLPPQFEPPIPIPPVTAQEPEIEEDVQPTPVRRRPAPTRSIQVVRLAGPRSDAHAGATQEGGLANGANAGSAGPVGTWTMPHPPYPSTLLAHHVAGATTVRVTTDTTGRVNSVVILKSAGNPVFDHLTETYVRTNWHGPPNAARTTQFVYQIK